MKDWKDKFGKLLPEHVEHLGKYQSLRIDIPLDMFLMFIAHAHMLALINGKPEAQDATMTLVKQAIELVKIQHPDSYTEHFVTPVDKHN